MIGHDVARPGPEEAVTVYDKDGLKSRPSSSITILLSLPTATASSIAGGPRW